jgi:predicted phage terminase large subunit-like protein
MIEKLNYHYSDGIEFADADNMGELLSRYPHKMLWFLQQKYFPHYWQTLFHTMQYEGHVPRYRHLVAGRRGGKTLSAAWEVLFYILHPEIFHSDVHGAESDRPLYVWVLVKDYVTGLASKQAFRDALKQSGLTHGREYKENIGNSWFTFENGAFVHFRTAEDPQSLRGAGLDVMWIDESAHISDGAAWEVARPALSDKRGIVITTTTPTGKNWFYRTFFDPKVRPNQGTVEYRSIDSSYFSSEEWMEVKAEYHPLMFKQEFMAAFDAMAGKELPGDWLQYYTEAPKKLQKFIGVDPAISLSDDSDRFAMVCVGVAEDYSKVYLLDVYAGRIPFPEQVEKIEEWYIKHRPMYIGVEAVAYQNALVQQLERLPSLPPVTPVFSKGKKSERILRMSPLFKMGKVLIKESQTDFIDEWLDYDSQVKNPNDDVLDAAEIAISSAGAILPMLKKEDKAPPPVLTLEEMVRRDLPHNFIPKNPAVDPAMGSEW